MKIAVVGMIVCLMCGGCATNNMQLCRAVAALELRMQANNQATSTALKAVDNCRRTVVGLAKKVQLAEARTKLVEVKVKTLEVEEKRNNDGYENRRDRTRGRDEEIRSTAEPETGGRIEPVEKEPKPAR